MLLVLCLLVSCHWVDLPQLNWRKRGFYCLFLGWESVAQFHSSFRWSLGRETRAWVSQKRWGLELFPEIHIPFSPSSLLSLTAVQTHSWGLLGRWRPHPPPGIQEGEGGEQPASLAWGAICLIHVFALSWKKSALDENLIPVTVTQGCTQRGPKKLTPRQSAECWRRDVNELGTSWKLRTLWSCFTANHHSGYLSAPKSREVEEGRQVEGQLAQSQTKPLPLLIQVM